MVRTWWAAVALLAIFAMHGLASHAAAAESVPVATPSAPLESDGPHAAHHQHPQAVLDAATGAALEPLAALDADGHDGGHHAMQVLGLCVAVLATAAIALLRLVGPTRGVLALRPRALRTAPAPVAATHAHAPPDLHALSVLRC